MDTKAANRTSIEEKSLDGGDWSPAIKQTKASPGQLRKRPFFERRSRLAWELTVLGRALATLERQLNSLTTPRPHISRGKC